MRANKSKKRLENVLKTDRLNVDDAFVGAVACDVYNLLKEYFQPVEGSMDLEVLQTQSGYKIVFSMNATRIINVKVIG